VNKYCEGKMGRTLKGVFKDLEIKYLKTIKAYKV